MRRRRKVTIEATQREVRPTSYAEPQPRSQAGIDRAARNRIVNAADEPGDAPCCVCGGPVHPHAPDDWGPWRRHPRCATVTASPARRAEAAARAYAIPIEEGDGDLVRFAVANFYTVHAEPIWTDEPMRVRLPWRHVDRDGLAAAVAELPRLRAENGRVPTTCTMGACAWCGVAESLVWTAHGHTWHDGTQAALCGSCSAIYVSTGEPPAQQWELQRDGIAQAATSMPIMMEEHVPDGVRAFAEGEGVSDGSPWSHLDAEALEAYRWSRWTRYGSYAPPEHRQEALRRSQAAQEAKLAQMAAQEAARAAQEDVYGFAKAGEAR